MARVGIFTSSIPNFRYNASSAGLGHVDLRNFEETDFGFLGRSANSGGVGQFDLNLGPTFDSGGTTFTYANIYFYMRFRIDRAPDSATDILQLYIRTSAAIEFHVQLNNARELLLYNDAGTANLIATSSALTLGAWVEITGRVLVNTTTANLGKLQFSINGASLYDNFSAGSIPGAGVGLNMIAALPIYKVIPTLGLSSNVGAEIDFDQLIIDDADAVTTPSYFTQIPLTAQGTFDQWSTSGGADLTKGVRFRTFYMTSMVDNGVSAPYMQTLGAGNQQSYTAMTLAACGLDAGSGVKSAIIVHDTQTVGLCRHFYTLNGGSEQYEGTPVGVPTLATYSIQSATSWGLTDTIEVGIRAVSGGLWRCGYLGLWIEHTSPIAPDPNEDFTIERVNYTGNGAGASGPLVVTLPFEPTFLVIVPRTGTGVPHFWGTMAGYIFSCNDALRRAAYVLDDKLILANADINANGVVYDVICVQDPVGRIFGNGSMYQMTQTVPFDTDNEQVLTQHTDPLAVWSMSCQTNFAAVAGYLMGPTQASNSCVPFVAGALTANIIDALNATGFVMKKGRYTNLSGMQYPFISFKPSGFRNTQIFDIVTWTGDATVDRTIPVPSMPASTPVHVIVFPHNNSARYMRDNQQAAASNFAGGAVSSTVLHTFAAGSFKVSGTLNTSAVNYTAFVFVEGTDSGIILNQYSGIYYIDPNARHETLWDRSGADPATINIKIPNILVRTAFIGDR